MTHRQILVFDDPAVLADAAAQYIATRARAAAESRGSFTIALSGGSTPRAVFERLARSPLRDSVPWAQTYLFWGDERAVPLDSADSNYRMARESLIDGVPIPRDQVKPMPAHHDDLDAAALHYERVVRCFVPGDPPRFDLILLGMGPDGHTASLFPHSPALDESSRLVVATPEAPLEPHVRRLTFTATLINAAAEALFLVAGADKAARLSAVIDGPRQPHDLPAQLIAPAGGELRWMVDRDAASRLNPTHE
jgi:6-phosphogluconolactonase